MVGHGVEAPPLASMFNEQDQKLGAEVRNADKEN